MVLAGNPAKNIDDVEKVETVFKDGVGYDPAKRHKTNAASGKTRGVE